MTPQLVIYATGVLLGVLLLGMAVGRHAEARVWRASACRLQRWPVRSRGLVFYVLPEAELMELETTAERCRREMDARRWSPASATGVTALWGQPPGEDLGDD